MPYPFKIRATSWVSADACGRKRVALDMTLKDLGERSRVNPAYISGMKSADYLIKILLLDLAKQGVGIEELRWIVSIFDPNRESDALS
jgi:hypothetical protein